MIRVSAIIGKIVETIDPLSSPIVEFLPVPGTATVSFLVTVIVVIKPAPSS